MILFTVKWMWNAWMKNFRSKACIWLKYDLVMIPFQVKYFIFRLNLCCFRVVSMHYATNTDGRSLQKNSGSLDTWIADAVRKRPSAAGPGWRLYDPWWSALRLLQWTRHRFLQNFALPPDCRKNWVPLHLHLHCDPSSSIIWILLDSIQSRSFLKKPK